MITYFQLIFFIGKNGGSPLVWSNTSWQKSVYPFKMLRTASLKMSKTAQPSWPWSQATLHAAESHVCWRQLHPCSVRRPIQSQPIKDDLWGPSLPPEHPLGAPRDMSIFLGLWSCMACEEWIGEHRQNWLQALPSQVGPVTSGYFLNDHFFICEWICSLLKVCYEDSRSCVSCLWHTAKVQ